MAKLSPEAWVRAASARLALEGVDKVRVEALAKELGVSKGSFYWHFSDRPALLAALLDNWEHEATLAIIEEVEAADEPAPARLRQLMGRVFRTPLSVDLQESAIRAWAVRDEEAQAVVRRVDRRRVDYVKRLLVEAGVEPRAARQRADLLYRALIGEFVVRSYGGKALPSKTVDALFTLLIVDS